MTTSKGRVKVLDFGLAKVSTPLGKENASAIETLARTRPGYLLGTVQYMSPEQALGQEVDQRTDIFSLGVVVYEMATGRLPFSGTTTGEILDSIIHAEPEAMARFNGKVPAELERITWKCLDKEPDRRYPSASDLLVDLRNLKRVSDAGTGLRPARVPRTIPRLAVVATLVVLAIVAFISLYLFTRPVPIRSLAILPLKNMSGDPKEEYFADGMTEELTTTLAQIESLHVISRTSVMEYKDTKISLPEIAKELNVDAVVEGSVMKVGNQVRITAQLIEAKTDRHLWAKSYERDLSDILSLQNEVASAISNEINAKLSPQEQEVLANAPRVNPDAYQAYLRGLDLWDRPDFSRENMQQAIEMFERAVELDPNFAKCYAELAEAHTIMYWAGFDRTAERLKVAKDSIDRAFVIQPDSPEAHLALGYYYYRGYKDYEHALREFAIAEKSLPNSPGILLAKAAVLRRQGKFEAAVNDLKKASELNPRAYNILFDIAGTYTIMRIYSEAERYCDRSISLAPDQLVSYQFKAHNYLLWKGDTRMARSTLEKMPKKKDPGSILSWFKLELYERNYQRALNQLFPAFDIYFLPHVFRTESAGMTYRLMKEPELARTSFDAARILLEQGIKENPNDSEIHSSLGVVYAGLNQKDAAIREGKLGVELGGISKDAFSGPDRVQDLAAIYVMVGEYETALDLIEQLLSIPSLLSVSLLRIDPVWDPLRSHPRFQKLLK